MSKKKLESTFINMVGILTLVTLISAAALGSIFNLTKDRIAAAKEAKKLKAIQEVVLEGFDNSPGNDMFKIQTPKGDELECFPARTNGNITSVAVKTYTKMGFSGNIALMVGFLRDGTIHNISVLEQKETPGLGTKITGKRFLAQFKGQNPKDLILKVKQDGGDIDAITAATISSRAFCDAVDRAYKSYATHSKL
ncbi:MAG: RnfABCDGE type electron transport complex subunit G [Bacteriovoracaceae bacterium]|nr:RnfABCDGE type electron transport complex subunit G [Bacteriovoracaceae bacterium]